MDLWIKLAGTVLVGLALADLYITVLYTRGDVSLVTRRFNRMVWWLLQSFSRIHRGAGSWALSFAGSLLLIADIAIWGILLLLGFALVVWPDLGDAIRASGDRETPTDFVTAVYYAGYCLTTLGSGELIPRTPFLKLLMIAKAALGFSFITLSLTYLVSVYDTLRRRNAFARLLHHSTGDSGDPSVMLAQLLRVPVAAAVHQNLTTVSDSLAQHFEDHHFYPILHYYRHRERHYATARILYVALDTATLVESLLDEHENRWLVRSSAVSTLWQTACATARDLNRDFLPSRRTTRAEAPDQDELRRWQEHLATARARFERTGITCRSDHDAALSDYVQQRHQWNTTVREFAIFTKHGWRDIASTAAEDPHTWGQQL